LPRAIHEPRGAMWVGPGSPAEPTLSVGRSMRHGDHCLIIILLAPIILGPALSGAFPFVFELFQVRCVLPAMTDQKTISWAGWGASAGGLFYEFTA
jgi:hypothetical protein